MTWECVDLIDLDEKRDPVTRNFFDLYHVKFAPDCNMHGLMAEKLSF